MSKQIQVPERRIEFMERGCKERGWHRVRNFTLLNGEQYARCIDCGKEGDIEWASAELLREHAS